MHRRAIALSLLLVPALASHLVTGPSEAASTAGECSLPAQVLTRADLPSGTSVVACAAIGRRLALGHGVGVEVPEPGTGVTVSALGVDEANSAVLSVDVTPAGEIIYRSSPAVETTTTTTSDPSPAACDDPTYGLLTHKWYAPMSWRLNTTNKPANLTATQTLQAIREGGENIVNAANDCGEVDDVSAGISYLGASTAAVDMFTLDGIIYCDVSSATNKASTVTFASMPSGYLAATCTWRTDRDPDVDEATESDMRLNLSKGWTTTPGAEGCSGHYDLEYVVTHERGHTYGLADLAGDHTRLTMFERGTSCWANGRTLGLGDLMGLRVHY